MKLLNQWLLVALVAMVGTFAQAEESPVTEDTVTVPSPESVQEQAADAAAKVAVEPVVEEALPEDASGASATAADVAPVSLPVGPALPDYGEPLIIGNDFGIVEITTEQAAIRRFRLRGIGPVVLPDHYLKPEQRGQDLDEHLAVMGVHFAGGSLHNWLNSLGLSYVGPQGNRGTKWEVLEQSASAVTLGYVEAATGIRYGMRYTMRPDQSTVDISLLVSNEGSSVAPFSPVIYPINGVHQDVGSNESYYLTVAEHRGGPNGDLVRRDAFPATGARTEPSVIDGSFDYLALKSRLFAAIWKPQGFDIGPDVTWSSAMPEAVVTPTPTTEVVGGGGPGGGGPGGSTAVAMVNASPLAGKPHRLQVYAQGFEQDAGGTNPKRQAFVTALYTNADGSPFALNPGESMRISYSITATSMRGDDLARLSVEEQRLEYTDGFHRFFRILSSILAWMLQVLAGIPGVGYGLGVILLTILIKGLLYRTTFKQQKSMMAMQKLGPELKRIQEQYKSDPQARNAKTMELWKKHGVNPLGGCLPIFIQMPIFIALYQAFSHVAELRGESFLWINDLTLPDQIAYLGNFAGFNITLNILPILYIIISLFMTFSNKPPVNSGSEQTAQMMKMMRWMPVMFGVIFYSMPSGLVLYFTMSALISTIELKYIRHKLGMNNVK